MTDEQKNALLSSQQGELDAVLMYQKLAKNMKDPEIKELLLESAKDEGRHAGVFHKLTGETLKPNPLQANAVSFLSHFVTKKFLFKTIASFEYKAGDSYKKFIDDFPEIAPVLNDETMHGDRMMEISNRFSKKK